MKAVLLAAGLGKRLLPITKSIPKPMIMIAGKPLLEYIIDDLINTGFDDICIVIGHLGYQIKNYFKDGSEFNIKIRYVVQENYTGTATAVGLAKKFVNNEPFLLYLADTIIPNNFKLYLQNMLNDESEINLLTAKIGQNEITQVGNVDVVNNYVTKISEKSSSSTSNFGWAGIALFKSNYIFQIIETLHPSSRGEYDITEAMNLVLNNHRKIRNQTCDRYVDSGTISGILELNNFILTSQHYPTLDLSKTNSYILNNPIYVGKNCKIGNNVKIGPFVSIGDNVTIDNDVELEQSIILDDTCITSNQNISKSLVNNEGKISLP